MKKYLILIFAFLALLPLTGCPQAAQLFTPGSFDADKTTPGGAKSKEGSDDATDIDKIVSTDAPLPPPTSTPPPGTPPEEKKLFPISGEPTRGGDSDQQISMYRNEKGDSNFIGPIDPKNDSEGVVTVFARYRLRFGPGPGEILAKDGSSYRLFLRRNFLSIKFLLETSMIPPEGDETNPMYVWTPEHLSRQVRLIFIPEGKTEAEAKCLGAGVTNDVALDHNISFSNVPVGAGKIVFYLTRFQSDCQDPALSDFGAGYQAFVDDTNHAYLGSLLLTPPPQEQGIRRLEP